MPRISDIILPETTLVENILTTYRKASHQQKKDGMTWYDTAHHLAVRLDPDNPLRAAGVISALSPMMDWARNMFLAERAYAEGRATGCLTTSCRKANDILNGSDVMKTLNAPKTMAFAATIANPRERFQVVIDRHALSVALGRSCTDKDASDLNRKGAYEMYANAYRVAAKKMRITPSQMQAITWTVWRDSVTRSEAIAARRIGRQVA